MALVGHATIVMSVVAPAIVEDKGVTLGDLGIVFSAVALGGIAGAMLVNRTENLIGRKMTISGFVLMIAAGLLLTIPATSVLSLIAVRVLTGVGIGGAIPITMATAAEVVPLDRAAQASSTVAAGAPIGTFLTGIIGGFSLEWTTWRVLFLGGGLISVGAAALLVWLVQSQSAQMTEITSGESSPRVSAGMIELIRSRHTATGRLLVVALGSSVSMYIIGSWLPTILSVRGMTFRDANVALVLFTLGGSFGALMLGRYFMGRRPSVSIATSYLLGAVATGVLAFKAPTTLIYGLALASGVTGFGAHLSLFSLINLVYRNRLRVAAQGVLVVVFRLGGFLGPLVASALIWSGVSLDYVVIAAAMFLAVTGLLLGSPDFRVSQRYRASQSKPT